MCFGAYTKYIICVVIKLFLSLMFLYWTEFCQKYQTDYLKGCLADKELLELLNAGPEEVQ